MKNKRLELRNWISNRLKGAALAAKGRLATRRLALESLEPRTVLTAGAFLTGTSFVDTNANSVLDAGDVYKANATISLYAVNGSGNRAASPLATTTTDANGKYKFDDVNVPGGLAAGKYDLVETPPSQ